MLMAWRPQSECVRFVGTVLYLHSLSLEVKIIYPLQMPLHISIDKRSERPAMNNRGSITIVPKGQDRARE